MAALVVFGLALGWFAWRRHLLQQQLSVVAELKVFGAAAPDGSNDITQLSFSGDAFRSEALPRLAKLPHLRRLKFINAPVSDQDIKALGSLRLNELRELMLINAVEITDEALADLAQMPQLQTLWLEQAKITDEGLKELKRFPKLEVLNLIGTRITDKGLTHLADCKALQEVILYQTRVTDAAFEQLRLDLPDVEVKR